MDKYKIKRIRYLDQIPQKWKSKKYYDWCKKKYHCTLWGWNMHHILIRQCDYLLYPLLKKEHDIAEKHKSKYFCKYLELSVLILQEYLRNVYQKEFGLKSFQPEELVELFEFTKKLEKR